MTDTQSDFARTDELDNALIPYDIIREQLGISHVTLWRKIKAAKFHPVRHNDGKALRWPDVLTLIESKRKENA